MCVKVAAPWNKQTKKKEKTAFSLLRSLNLFFLFFTPNDNKNLGAL
jgi:hypothetical protein